MKIPSSSLLYQYSFFYCCPADHLPQNNPFEHGPKECQHLLLLMACDKAQYKSKWVTAYVKIHDATQNHYHRQYYLMIQYSTHKRFQITKT